MRLPSIRSINLAVATLVGVVALACAGGDAPAAPAVPTPVQASVQAAATPVVPTPEQASVQAPAAPVVPTPLQASTPVPAAPAAPTPEPVVASSGYDSNRVMYQVLPWNALTAALMNDALERIRANRDQSLVPVLVEIIRFVPSASSRERVGDVLRDVTGQSIPSDDWNGWMEWLGRNQEGYQPPSQYADWKSDLMEVLDPRFAQFLRPASEFSRINLAEVVWGGVLPDGIPDLRDPRMVTAAEAEYLNDSDRVFGVTINGDSRAYPLRIVNAHEMVNDTVGGEPIALMW